MTTDARIACWNQILYKLMYTLTQARPRGAHPLTWNWLRSTVWPLYSSGQIATLLLIVSLIHKLILRLPKWLQTKSLHIEIASNHIKATTAQLQGQVVRMLVACLVALVVLLVIHYYSKARKYLKLPSPGLPLPVVTLTILIFKYIFIRLVISTSWWQRRCKKTQ